MALLQSLYVYPIKSTAGIALSNTWIDNIGLSFDRRFVVADHQGQFMTARTEPSLCLIRASLTPTGLILTAPDMPALEINYQAFSDHYQSVTVWKDEINSRYCSLDYDLWFSDYLKKPCQLLFFGEKSSRQVKNKQNQVGFADGYPQLLISQASLDDLNARMPNHQITMAQFRPNIVVEGTEAFEEDKWQHIRIGEVEFEVTKPCTRCIFTTVDPDTAEKHPKQEPLSTLKHYRKDERGEIMFGQNLVALNQGRLEVGDQVTVLSTQSPPQFVVSKQLKAVTQNKTARSDYSTANQLTLRCIKIIDDTHDVKTFTFENTEPQLIQYQAGQHLPISFEIDGKKVHRSYTISSSPTRPERISITVKRVCDFEQPGVVSNFLHDHFNVGDTIDCQQPNGNFHIEAENHQPILMLSAGSGITPMLSMLRAHADLATKNDIIFFHSAHTDKDLIAFEEVKALAKQHGSVRLDFTLTKQAPPSWTDFQGRINKDMLAKLPRLKERNVYVCGPKAFREAAKEQLLALGLPESQFFYESFGTRTPPQSQAPAIEPMKDITIHFKSWDKEVIGNNKETLLEIGEEAGMILPFSCRAGMCASCKMKLVDGEVEVISNDGLTDFEQEQGYILSCSCIPKTNVTVEKP